jgi:hypothetical protein
MYAVQFETDINDGVLTIPLIYKEIYKSHAKVTITVEDIDNKPIDTKIDFSSFKIDSFKNINPLEFQRQARDEW